MSGDSDDLPYLLRREARHSGVWFKDQLLEAAMRIETLRAENTALRAAISTHPTPTAEQGGEIGKQHRDLWQSSILTMYSTEPQRRAFVDGYNGREKPHRASAGMAKAWSLGAEVSRLLNPNRWPDPATLTKSNGDPA